MNSRCTATPRHSCAGRLIKLVAALPLLQLGGCLGVEIEQALFDALLNGLEGGLTAGLGAGIQGLVGAALG